MVSRKKWATSAMTRNAFGVYLAPHSIVMCVMACTDRFILIAPVARSEAGGDGSLSCLRVVHMAYLNPVSFEAAKKIGYQSFSYLLLLCIPKLHGAKTTIAEPLSCIRSESSGSR